MIPLMNSGPVYGNKNNITARSVSRLSIPNAPFDASSLKQWDHDFHAFLEAFNEFAVCTVVTVYCVKTRLKD